MTRPRPTRRTRSAIFAAVAPLCLFATPAVYAGEDDKGGGSGTPTPTPAPTPTATKGDKGDDFEARLAAAREEGRRQAAEEAEAKAAREKAEREEAAAKEQGKWKEVAEKAERERDAARMESQSRAVDVALRDYLAEKHPAYLPVARYVRPLVAFDAATTPETIAKRVAEAADQYARDNPRTGASAGPGPGPGRSGLPRGTQVPAGQSGGTNTRPPPADYAEAVSRAVNDRYKGTAKHFGVN